MTNNVNFSLYRLDYRSSLSFSFSVYLLPNDNVSFFNRLLSWHVEHALHFYWKSDLLKKREKKQQKPHE